MCLRHNRINANVPLPINIVLVKILSEGKSMNLKIFSYANFVNCTISALGRNPVESLRDAQESSP